MGIEIVKAKKLKRVFRTRKFSAENKEMNGEVLCINNSLICH